MGPINVTIVNEGAKMGFGSAFAVGVGAVTMELIYCMTAFTGFAHLFDSNMIRAIMELMSFLLVSILGLNYLLARRIAVKNLGAKYIENKLHLRDAFTVGFVRILLNPVVLLFWITMASTVIAHEFVDIRFTSKCIYITGVGMGCLAWFWFLAYEVAKRMHKFSHKTLLNISRVSGALLLIMAVIVGRDLTLELMKLQ
ncbi:MAG: LysE family transporter [Verrucomicrobia bacterium]|nr:LysE family transporter [Verrucomicrobiota bacterium]MBR5737408.1 LysE family transporter [Verrucomicrobiota bacterium]MBR6460958.1 LysE family transporter [Verrucomicrobiota bacterium]